jgi:uncharacterized protein YraI
MRTYVFVAAVAAAALSAAPALARQMDGYTIRSTTMHAGPEYDYPTVQQLRANTGVIVFGCLRDWSWCDVSNRYDRGWIAGNDIVVDYQGQRRDIMPSMGIGVLSFVFGSYWDSHYRSKPFYAERPRWEQQYNSGHQPQWGPSARTPWVTPHPRQSGAGAQHGGTSQRQAAPQRQTPTRAPTETQRQNARPQRQAPGHQGGGHAGSPQARPNQNQRQRD